jgi:predicted dienelactone hydrolase
MLLIISAGCPSEVAPWGSDEPSKDQVPGGSSTWVGAPRAEDVRCRYGEVPSQFILTHQDVAKPGTYDVGVEDLTFVDETRSTPSNGQYKGSNTRQLKTTIYYPAAPKPLWQWGKPMVAEGKPFPLIVYSHGFSSSKEEAKTLASHLASHGYIVVAPNFPLSGMFSPGGANFIDIKNQPGDISFLIDQLIDRGKQPEDRYFGAADPERIGVIGLSFGALTSYLSAFHPTLGDPRIKVAVSLAGPSSFFSARFYRNHLMPLLVVHGEIDAFIPYQENARATFERAQPNVNLVTIIAGSHTGFASLGPDFFIKLIGSVVAPDGAHPDNPDALGCGFVAQQIENKATQTNFDFFDGIGGEEEGIVVPESGSLPCDNDFITYPALKPARQLEITKKATLAFLQAHLGPSAPVREQHCHFLNQVLSTDADAVVE